jgi:hypothetical protein
MNLVETFDTLTAPETVNRNLFNAVTLTDYPFAKIAINNPRAVAISASATPAVIPVGLIKLSDPINLKTFIL